MSSSNSPCAACKFLRRKCTQGCVFAPYFPPDQPQKFAHVHRVFGASNVAKLLNELSPSQREDAVNSLAYEAEARLRDPVYGCVGYISILQHKLKQVQHDLYNAKKELSAYIGPAALGPFLPLPGQPFIGSHHPQLQPQQHLHHQAAGAAPLPPFGVVPGVGMGMGLGLATGGASQILLREQQQQQHQHQQIAEAQMALAVAAREQEIMRSYEQQQNELTRLNSGFDGRGRSGFNQVAASIVVPTAPASGVALVPAQPFDNLFNVQHQQPQQQQHFQEQPPLHHHKAGSDEGKRVLG